MKHFQAIVKLQDLFKSYSHVRWRIANGWTLPGGNAQLFSPTTTNQVNHNLWSVYQESVQLCLKYPGKMDAENPIVNTLSIATSAIF